MIEVENLRKFSGSTSAPKEVSLAVKQGEIPDEKPRFFSD